MLSINRRSKTPSEISQYLCDMLHEEEDEDNPDNLVRKSDKDVYDAIKDRPWIKDNMDRLSKSFSNTGMQLITKDHKLTHTYISRSKRRFDQLGHAKTQDCRVKCCVGLCNTSINTCNELCEECSKVWDFEADVCSSKYCREVHEQGTLFRLVQHAFFN
jgi:hypothetical protein